MSTATNSQTVQDLKNGGNDQAADMPVGPVGQNVAEQKVKTQNEFQDLANSKRTPDQPAATGQPLTHYHSLFYRLLSWKNPRATSIAYVSTVVFIFLARYLNILRYIFKGTYTVLGITAAAEIVGHAALGEGLTSKIRPKKYFVIQRDSMERFLDDIEQLTNFFVIESQRIVFAENTTVTVAAFASAFISYWLIKWVPLWGLSLIAANVVFLAPLIYTQNKELIDGQLNSAGEVINKQTAQARDIAGQYTSKAQQSVGAYTKQAHQQISGLIGQKNKPTETDYPQAPKQEPYPAAPVQEPAADLKAEGQPPVAAVVSAFETIHRASTDLTRRLNAPTRHVREEIAEPECDSKHETPILHGESISQLLAEREVEEHVASSLRSDTSFRSDVAEPSSSATLSQASTFAASIDDANKAASDAGAARDEDSDEADSKHDRRNTVPF